MVTGSKELIRDINTNLVLETIINHASISRASIAKHLGLTKATVSAIVQDLINRKLVIEIGSDDTSLGRKPILLSLHKKAGYVICIDIGVDTISALVSDLTGEDLSLKQIKTPKNITGLVNVLIQLIESMKLPKITPYGLVGITLGIHGVTMNNKVSFAPYYNLTGIQLAEGLGQYFNTPVYLENEANLSVIGEKAFQYDYVNIANISVHSGIGLGIIINNQLYTGYNGRAGEFGHTIVEIDGRQCPCGNLGCLEQYVSERILLQEFADKKGLSEISFDTFKNMYEEQDPDAIQIMNRFIKYMSVGINNILNAYNPDIVIINSSFTIHFPQVTKQIEDALKSKMNSYISICPSALQDTSILLGGICVAIKGFLGIKHLKLNHVEYRSQS
ncbi:ROK family transcriptional regulator [Mobilitalea sibirica]|uniref:ROK family transcriptional regulator n=1 Tax=Mobilitalea sibirica TaxID=1462919 RepID=A0A8J7HE35_9FIRM|nr:ROK family transcriptional regulator [Mobilitalea sibirica]MBH1941554.1 ROK family transcriptional regulator [Mobilitalea sibirica]